MRRPVTVPVLIVLALGVITQGAMAGAEEAPTSAHATKMVFLRGYSSYVMKGDSAPRKADADEVLPALLQDGWLIVELIMPGEQTRAGNPPGVYVTLRKPAADSAGQERKSRLVAVRADTSRALKGAEWDGSQGEEALPASLKRGWVIRAVKIFRQEPSNPSLPEGWVLLEKQ